MPAPIALRLATRQWAARPLRPILCSIAIAAAVALILCVGVAMDSLKHTIVSSIGKNLGIAEIHVRPAQRDTDARMLESLLQQLKARPDVELIGGRLYTKGSLGRGETRTWFDVLGLDPATDETLRPKNYIAGRPLSNGPAAASEIVIDSMVIKKIPTLKLGDSVDYATNDGEIRPLKIVGIVQQATIELLAKPTLYISLDAMAKDMGIPRSYKVIDIKFKETAPIGDYDEFAKVLQKELGPSVDVQPGTSAKAQLADMTRTMAVLLLLLSTMAAICASLIIGTTLSVGVQERVRQFGQLRCIGASRGQLALFLLADAAVMLTIGAVLGILLGTALSAALVAYFPSFFSVFQVAPNSILISLFCGALATFFGAAIPIWQVTRVSPMAAVTSVAQQGRPQSIRRAALIGLSCLALQALLWIAIPGRDARFYTYVILGIPLIFGGWCLLAPAVLTWCEGLGATALGALFQVRPSLLRTAWSRTPWRAGAMIAALMIGSTLLVTVRARGASLLASWTAPARIPDLIVKYLPSNGVSDKRLAQLRTQFPEFTDITRLEVFSVTMGDKLFRLGKLFGEGETSFVAVDPVSFPKMVELEYIEGDPAEAARKLAQGRHLFVSKEFKNVRKLGVGDTIKLRAADGKIVDFTIAAVVTSTGIELVKNYFDLRQSFGEKAISSVMGSVADGQQYFSLGEPSVMLINVSPSASSPESMAQIQQKMRPAMESISSAELKQMLKGIITNVIDGLSVIGFSAMCLASLGVANMVIASVHARRFEFGVLRAIGAGRGQLVRLVLAEVTLIGLVAGLLGAGAGLHFAYMGSLVDYLVIGFPTNFLAASFAPALLIAATLLLLSILCTTLLGWLAALAPALRGASTAQRTLLASGRA